MPALLMSDPPTKEEALGLAAQVRLSQAVNSRHRAEVEQFHRRGSFLHGDTVGLECTPFLESTVYQQWVGHQVRVGLRCLDLLKAPAGPDLDRLCRPPSQRRFGPVQSLTYPRLQQFLSQAYCAPGARPGRGAVASAGAVYPVHVVLIPRLPITGAPFAPGQVLHVSFLEHSLDLLAERPAAELEQACFGHPIDDAHGQFAHAAFTIAYVFDLDAGTLRYGVRGYRFGLLECGAMTHQAALAANALGLGSCLFGGFADAQLAVALGLRPQTMLVSCVQVFGEAELDESKGSECKSSETPT